jgi:hypothetical protein
MPDRAAAKGMLRLFYDDLVAALRRRRCSVSIFILVRRWPAAARHELTTNDVDDASQVGPLLDQVVKPVASFTGDGAYEQDRVYRTLAGRQLKAAVVVPPRATAVPRGTATIEPTGHCHQSFPSAAAPGASVFSGSAQCDIITVKLGHLTDQPIKGCRRAHAHDRTGVAASEGPSGADHAADSVRDEHE